MLVVLMVVVVVVVVVTALVVVLVVLGRQDGNFQASTTGSRLGCCLLYLCLALVFQR